MLRHEDTKVEEEASNNQGNLELISTAIIDIERKHCQRTDVKQDGGGRTLI